MAQSRRSTPIAYLMTCSPIWARSSSWRMRDSRSVVTDGPPGSSGRATGLKRMTPNRLTQDDRGVDYLGAPSYSAAMPAKRDRPAKPAAPPAATGHPGVDDLTWLAHRAADALRAAFNKVSNDADVHRSLSAGTPG